MHSPRQWLASLLAAFSVPYAGQANDVPLLSPAPYSHLTFSGDSRGFWLFNQETGNIYRYDFIAGKVKRRFMGAVQEAGKALSSTEAVYNPLSVPRSHLRALATNVLEELRIVTAAVDQWAVENNKPQGVQPTAEDIRLYVHRATRLRYWLDQGICKDSLGNPIVIPTTDGLPVLSRATFQHFAGVVPADFWIPFPVAAE
jgi:hypothetical protein